MENNSSHEVERSLEEKVKDNLQGYADQFRLIRNILAVGTGIGGVHKVFEKGHKILSVQEYIAKCRKEGKRTISESEEQNLVFITKAQKLNQLAEKLNSAGKDIEEEALKEIVKEVGGVIAE